MSLRFEKALQRERARQRRQRKGRQHTELSARMDTPTLSPAGVGSATAPPPLDTRLSDLVAELTTPVDPTRLNQEIEDFNISYPVDVDNALNLMSVSPVAGVGTEPTTTTTTTSTAQTTTTTTTGHHLDSHQAVTTSTRGRQAVVGTTTTTTTATRPAPTPRRRPTVAAKQPGRRPRPPSPPSSPSPPPSDDEDRRRGLQRRLDLLNEDAQQRSRGRRIRNITHTNTVTTVYEGGERPSVRRTSTRTSGPSPPQHHHHVEAAP